ncbi:MAG TPA: FAD-dependent monooxygenase [Bryobacteraceae bacterium]|nr:FAD-dependent monooxygenase [Bryobacteraceae bacterium]
MHELQNDIVIVGAGPSGLALAAELKRLGISALILDRLAAGANTSRAVVVHARTLEVLQPLAVTPELLQAGVIVPIFRIRDRGKILASISFKDLDTPYPFTLMCPQARTEAILLRRLQSLGADVERPAEVVSIRPAGADVEVQFKRAGEISVLRTKWLVGCDGAHSLVREQASIPFEGGAYDESFLLGDVELDWPLDREEVSLFYSEKGLMVVAPLPGSQHFRIVATVRQAPENPSLADFERILAERGPQNGTVAVRRLAWSSRFHIQHRVAKVLRQGRVLLAGDAAHVHSPAGGQGMNTGIQDAIALAGALQSTLQSGKEDALEDWQNQRLETARSVVSLTDRMTKIATLSSPVLKALRNATVGIIGHIPSARHALAETLAELDRRPSKESTRDQVTA